MKRDLHFEMTYPQAPEQVWAALTNAEALATWLMPNDFELRIGHRFKFRTKPAPGFDGIVNCEVLEITHLERLVYSWVGGGVDTRVIWTLTAIPEGTRLQLDHIGFKGLRGILVSTILGKGWRSKILSVNLPALLARWSGVGPIPPTPEAECHRDAAR
jgi:uncharacterized protein YndB with AHSA1/START domain